MIVGGAGNDATSGSGGGDVLIGGDGGDRFVFRTQSDSTASNFDTLNDFVTGTDKFDFVAFGLASTNVFQSNGTAAAEQTAPSANFFHVGGVTYDAVSQFVGAKNTFVYVDLNHDGNFDTGSDAVLKLVIPCDANGWRFHYLNTLVNAHDEAGSGWRRQGSTAATRAGRDRFVRPKNLRMLSPRDHPNHPQLSGLSYGAIKKRL